MKTTDAGAAREDALPADVAFLADRGVARQALRLAARRSRKVGVCAAQVVLADGLAPPEIVYRALAAEIGAPFLERPDLSDAVAFPHSLNAGLAPLAAGGIVAAPSALAFGALIERGAAAGLCLTTPAALARAVFARRGREIAEEAANGLARHRPGHSFRGGFSRGQRVAAGLVALASLALAVHAPILAADLVFGLGVVAGVLFLAMATLRLATCLEPAALAPIHATPRAPDADLPVYTVVVPLYREAGIVEGLCEALRALDYPCAKLDVKLVVEEDDAATRAAIAGLDLPGMFEIVVAPAGLPRTKPRALNVALPLARGTHLVVFDAEDRPDPDQLRLAVAAFAREGPEVACLQARLSIHNRSGWLPRLFAIEYAALFDVVNPGLLRLGLPIPLGGTSNHFRTPVLRAIHGWDAHNVTEDADLGIRLAVLGLRTADLPSTTQEEAPGELGNWLRQRARWMKGFMQVCVVHTRAPGRTLAAAGPGAGVALALLVGGTAFAALAYPVFLAVAVVGLLAASGLAAWPLPVGAHGATGLASATIATSAFLAGLVAIWAPALVGLVRRGWLSLIPLALALPLYYALVSLAAWRGLYELLTRPTHWHKTAHGAAVPPPARAPPPPVQIRRRSSAAASEGARVVSSPAMKRPCASMM